MDYAARDAKKAPGWLTVTLSSLFPIPCPLKLARPLADVAGLDKMSLGTGKERT
jgi:hypothetical protein